MLHCYNTLTNITLIDLPYQEVSDKSIAALNIKVLYKTAHKFSVI